MTDSDQPRLDARDAPCDARQAAIAALFGALEDMLRSYQLLPDADRARCCSDDADRITGEVARHLTVARTRLAATVVPVAGPDLS